MAISPFEINGMMGRTQDFTVFKHQEDNKSLVEQNALQNQAQKQVQNKSEKVQTSQQSETQQQRKDAKDKGSNEYTGDGGRNRKRNQEVPIEGRVVPKGMSGSHFEWKV